MLNAWFKNDELDLHKQVDLGLAIDSAEGLFVPVLRNVDALLDTPKKFANKLHFIKMQ